MKVMHCLSHSQHCSVVSYVDIEQTSLLPTHMALIERIEYIPCSSSALVACCSPTGSGSTLKTPVAWKEMDC